MEFNQEAWLKERREAMGTDNNDVGEGRLTVYYNLPRWLLIALVVMNARGKRRKAVSKTRHVV